MSYNELIGCRLKHDIMNGIGLVLIPKDTLLTEKHLDYLESYGVSIRAKDIEKLSGRKTSNEALVVHAAEEIRNIFQRMRTDETIPIAEVQGSILPAIHQASDFPNLYSVLSGLHAKDDYTYRHNIGVGVIATLIGKWLYLDKEEQRILTVAATLHDIGKVRIPDAILNKPGKYTNEEYATMKSHTVYGCELIRQTADIDPRIGLVALQHHEREDGRGYPYGISGDRIEFFSKIVGVADIFHAMTSERVYKKAMPFYQVMQEMTHEGFGKLDTRICNLFVKRMMEMSIGGEAVLSNGAIGKIILIHNEDPVNPSVMVGERYFDLRQHSGLHIEQLIS